MLAIVLVHLTLAQTPPAAAPPAPASAPSVTPAAAPSADDRAALAAEKAAEAAEKAAEAAALVASQLKPATPPMCVPPPAPPPPEAPPYDFTLGIGLLSLTGNTESVSGNLNAAGDYHLGEWILSSKLSGTYGESRATPSSPSAVLAEMGAFQIRIDRKFTDLIAAYALAGTDTDHIKSVEYDVIGEVGMSLFWWDTKQDDSSLTYLRTDIGFQGDQQSRFQYFPTPEALPAVTLLGPHVAVEFRKGLTSDLLFTEADGVALNVDGATRTVVNSLTKLSVRIGSHLALGGSFTISYDSAPAQGKLPTDTALALNLDYKA